MKLRKIQAVVVGDKTYCKYQITIPPSIIAGLGWEEGQKLKPEIKDNKLIIDVDDCVKIEKMSYEEFRDKIKDLLENTDCLTWAEIRVKAKLSMKVPGQHWVNRLKKDIGLEITILNGKKVWQISECDWTEDDPED